VAAHARLRQSGLALDTAARACDAVARYATGGRSRRRRAPSAPWRVGDGWVEGVLDQPDTPRLRAHDSQVQTPTRPRQLRQVGRRLGISGERVRQLETQALSKRDVSDGVTAAEWVGAAKRMTAPERRFRPQRWDWTWITRLRPWWWILLQRVPAPLALAINALGFAVALPSALDAGAGGASSPVWAIVLGAGLPFSVLRAWRWWRRRHPAPGSWRRPANAIKPLEEAHPTAERAGRLCRLVSGRAARRR